MESSTLLFFSFRRISRHFCCLSSNTSARATMDRSFPADRNWTAAPVPRLPQPISPALNGFPSGACFAKDGIPSCSGVKLVLFLLLFSLLLHEVISGVNPRGIDAPIMAEFAKNSLLFIDDDGIELVKVHYTLGVKISHFQPPYNRWIGRGTKGRESCTYPCLVFRYDHYLFWLYGMRI